MNLTRLYEAINLVCPIHSVNSEFGVSYNNATPEQMAAAEEVIANYIDTPEADAVWTQGKTTMQAVQWLASSTDYQAIAIRVALRDIYTMLNDGREREGLERIFELVTATRLIAGAGTGAGKPIEFT